MNGGLGELTLGPVAVDPTDPETLYVASQLFARVYKSTDGGASWVERSTGLPAGPVYTFPVLALLVDPHDSTTLYAGVATSGVFRSTDGGATWSAFNPGMTAGGIYHLFVGPAPASAVYAGTAHGLFRLDP